MSDDKFTIPPPMWSAVGYEFHKPDSDGDMAVRVLAGESELQGWVTAEQRRELILFLIDHTPIDAHNRAVSRVVGTHLVSSVTGFCFPSCPSDEAHHMSNYGALSGIRGSAEVRKATEAILQAHHSDDYGATAESWCDCDWLGEGTPRHAPSALCRDLRPEGPRSE